MSKKRKWCILETELHSHYYKDKDIFQPFTDECLIDDFKEAQEIGTMLRNKGYQTEVMPFDIEECDSNDFGTLGVYFERDVLTKKVEELKQQLSEKEDFIKTLGFKNEDKFREYVLNCLLNKEDKVNRIRELEQQLAEKDKECEGHYKNFVYQLQKTFDLEKQFKDQRHQICEKIREIVKDENLGNGFIEMSEITFDKKLDQIEKGE